MQVLRDLAEDTPSERAEGLALRLSEQSQHLFLSKTLPLPAVAIRALVNRWMTRKSAGSIFLAEAVSVDLKSSELVQAWQSAVDVLLALSWTPEWGTKKYKAAIQAIARNPRFLSAVQAAVVGSDDAGVGMLAVLAADGSDASVDALLPWFSRARDARSLVLDQLRHTRVHAAKNRSLDAMFAAVERDLDERNSISPALRFAQTLGINTKKFMVRVWLHSTPINMCFGQITIDSTRPEWLEVRVNWVGPGKRLGRTSFNHEDTECDQLGLGRCEASALPQWLRSGQEKLGIVWGHSGSIRSSLRGRSRDEFVEWLFGQSRK